MTNTANENYYSGITEYLRQWLPQIFPIVQFANSNCEGHGRNVLDAGPNPAILASFKGRAADIYFDRQNIDRIKIGDGFFKLLCTWHRQFNVESVTWNGQTWSETDGGLEQQKGLDINVDHLYIRFRSAASEVEPLIFSLLLYGLSSQVNATIDSPVVPREDSPSELSCGS